MEMMSFAPADRLSPWMSQLVVYVICGGGLVLLFVLAASRAALALWRAGRLTADVQRKRGLSRGPVLLPGVAEALDEPGASPGPFVEVVIVQVGSQVYDSTRSRNPFVLWTERERTLTAHPFCLRTDDGELVRVEPGSDVELIDNLDVTETVSRATATGGKPPGQIELVAAPGIPGQVDNTTRRRHARVTPGERIFVRGVLERPASAADVGPYRDDGSSKRWRLRPAQGEPLFISSQPVAREGLAAALLHGSFALAFLGVFLLCQLILFRPYHLLVREAVAAEATVVSRYHNPTIDEHKHRRVPITWYAFGFDYEAGHRRHGDSETNLNAYETIVEGTRVPILYAASAPEVVLLGRRSELGLSQGAGLSLVLVFGLTAAYVFAVRVLRPWWRGKKLVEKEPGFLYL